MLKLSDKEIEFLAHLFNKMNGKINSDYHGKPIAIYGEFFDDSVRHLFTKSVISRLAATYQKRGWDRVTVEKQYFDASSEIHKDKLWFRIILINTKGCIKEIRRLIDEQIKKHPNSRCLSLATFLPMEWNFVSGDTVYPALNHVKVIPSLRSYYRRLGWSILELKIGSNDFSLDSFFRVAMVKKVSK